MYTNRFYNFLHGEETLRVFERGELLFSSRKRGIIPWLEYIDMFYPYIKETVVFEKEVDNAVALLAVKAGCRRIYADFGSHAAALTLEKYNIKFRLIHIGDCHSQKGHDEICQLETLSLDKNPDEFYDLVRSRLLRDLGV